MSNHQFWWLFVFISIEFGLVTLFIVGCFLAKFYFYQKNLRAQRYVNTFIQQIKQLGSLPRLTAHTLQEAIEALDSPELNNIEQSQEIRLNILKTQILPIARNLAFKRNWERRYLLIRCYQQYIESQDADLLIKLIQDPIPVISLNAMKIAATLDNERMISAILEKLKLETHPFHALVVENLSPSNVLTQVIEQTLKTTQDPWLRKICYEFISKLHQSAAIFDIAEKDTESAILNLQIAAIRALPYLDGKQYLKRYQQLLQHSKWQIRSCMMKTLREYHDPKALDILAQGLSDEAWWVRMNAAKTLTFYGDAGRLLLTEFNATPLAHHEDADYFLKIQNIRMDAYHG